MKKIIILATAFLLSFTVINAQEKAGKQDTTTHISLYTCPMHPGVSTDKPGKCPKCGMTLVKKTIKTSKPQSQPAKKDTMRMAKDTLPPRKEDKEMDMKMEKWRGY